MLRILGTFLYANACGQVVGFLDVNPAKRGAFFHTSLFSSAFVDEGQILPEHAAALRSVTFSNVPKNKEPDLLCDFLMEIGACSTAIIDADRGTTNEQPIFSEPSLESSWRDTLQWAAPVWNRCNVTAHFPESVDIEWILTMIGTTFQQYSEWLQNYRLEQVPNKDWVVHVQQSWKPMVVSNKFILRFPWHTDRDVEEIVGDSHTVRRLVPLQLQGGVAFGTGEHPTTQLCLGWIDQVVSKQLADNRASSLSVLDYGAGSGVLGMAACALAPDRVTAVGIDIDVDACRIANANAANNRVAMRNYLPPLKDTPDDESKSLLLKAHAFAKRELSKRGESCDDLVLPTGQENVRYDICVSNILAGPLATLAPVIATMVRAGGFLGLSGILPEQGNAVVRAYQSAGFENVRVARELEGWVLVTGRKG